MSGSGYSVFGIDVPFTSVDKRIFELEPGESLDIEIEAIPTKVREAVVRTLRKTNKPVTDENILNLYKDYVGSKNES